MPYKDTPEWNPIENYELLCTQYGKKQISMHVVRLFSMLQNIALLHETLSHTGDESDEAYIATTQEIIEATQKYYLFIGNVPADLRKYLLYLADRGERLDEDDIHRPLEDKHTLPDFPQIAAQSIRPNHYIMQIDAITNQLSFLDNQQQLKVGGYDNRPVLTTVTLDMPDHMRIEGGHALSSYDRSIINGVTSLLESGNTFFSIPMLYHAITGRNNPTIDDILYEELSKKLDKMRRMMLTIDLSQEVGARFITDAKGQPIQISNLMLEGYLLPLNKVSGKINGKLTELYQIIQHPPLYTYSKMRRQLASVRITLLSAPVNNNATTIPLKTYLLQRIEMMKNQHNSITQQNIIYESIYEELGAATASKTKKMRIRTYTSTILEFFYQQQYIKGYAEYKVGRAVAGVRISLQ